MSQMGQFGRWLALVLLAPLLSACVSTTKLITNDKGEIKAADYSRYKTVYFITPKEDPRNVAPQVLAKLRAMNLHVIQVGPDDPVTGSQGTGFIVTRSGYVLTCDHVLSKMTVATLTVNQHRYIADVVAEDAKLDVALLKIRDLKGDKVNPVSFRSRHEYTMGEDVYTIGYPMSALLGNSARMTKGLLSASAGIKDNPDQIQISAEIAPGNSGGPVLDDKGQIIGMVQQTLNPWAVARETGGALPQNINFANKSSKILAFIKNYDNDVYKQLRFDHPAKFDQVEPSVVKIRSGNISPEWEKTPKLVLLLNYVSFWDMWYRFRVFLLRAYDYDSHQILFVAGQGRDNVLSNEEQVITDTMNQVKAALAR